MSEYTRFLGIGADPSKAAALAQITRWFFYPAGDPDMIESKAKAAIIVHTTDGGTVRWFGKEAILIHGALTREMYAA